MVSARPLDHLGRMGIDRLEDLQAFQLAVQLKLEIYRLVRRRSEASRDWRYRDQLFDAALGGESNIAEGWRRYAAGEMCQFLRYALASLAETDRRLRDGVDRGYFSSGDISMAASLCDRSIDATTNLWKNLQPFIRRKKKGAGEAKAPPTPHEPWTLDPRTRYFVSANPVIFTSRLWPMRRPTMPSVVLSLPSPMASATG